MVLNFKQQLKVAETTAVLLQNDLCLKFKKK